jgi:hypothetical protein
LLDCLDAYQVRRDNLTVGLAASAIAKRLGRPELVEQLRPRSYPEASVEIEAKWY